MLKLLKWDFGNFLRNYYWLYLSVAAALVISAVFPDNIHLVSTLVDGLCAGYSLFFFCYTLIISMDATISWLRKDSALLELSLPAKPWKILLSKLLLALCINVSGLLLVKLIWQQIGEFGMSNIVMFSSFSDFFQCIVGMLVLLTIFMFAYITAKSFRLTRNLAGITTVLLSSVTFLLVICLVFALFLGTGAWTVTPTWTVSQASNYGGISISINEKLRWLAAILNILCPTAIIIAGYLGSCALFKYRYERH